MGILISILLFAAAGTVTLAIYMMAELVRDIQSERRQDQARANRLRHGHTIHLPN